LNLLNAIDLLTSEWDIEIWGDIPFTRPGTPRHEYGHSVQASTLGTLPILEAASDLQLGVLFGCLDHSATDQKTRPCALTEGFAEYWELMTEQPAFPSNFASPGARGWADDILWETFDTRRIGAPRGGLNCEGNVAAWLWDLYDTRSDIRYPDGSLPPSDPSWDPGDDNAGVTIGPQDVLMAMRAVNQAGVGDQVQSAVDLWNVMTGAFRGIRWDDSLGPIVVEVPRRITPGQEYHGARAFLHNHIGIDLPPGPQPGGGRPPPILPDGHAIDPVAVIWPPQSIPDPTPSRFELGCDDTCGFGHTLAFADLDGDGRQDLLVEAPGLAWFERDAMGFVIPASRTSSGGALAFLAQADGTYSLSLAHSMYRQYGTDAEGHLVPSSVARPLGIGLAVGDLDGSGSPDDAAMTTYGELPGEVVLQIRSGGSVALRTLPGVFGGVWYVPEAVTLLDVNGDGADDVLAHAFPVSGPPYDEAVLVWLAPFPADRTAADAVLKPSTGPNALATGFGRGIVLADVDGDGTGDVVLGGAGADAIPLGDRAAGSVFRGPMAARSDPIAPSAILAAPFQLEGMGAFTTSIPGAGFGVAGLLFEAAPGWGLALYDRRAGHGNAPIDPAAVFPASSGGGTRPGNRTLHVRDVTGLGSAASIALGSGWNAGGWNTAFDLGHLSSGAGGSLALRSVAVPAPYEGRLFGYDAGLLGDMTQDGARDLAVSSPLELLTCYEGPPCEVGVVWVFSGADVR
jgi:hypothetical protein